MTSASRTAPSPDAALAAFAATLTYEDVPPSAIEAAKLLILDSIGTSLAATSIGDGCREVVGLMRRLGGPLQSTILGTGAKVPAPNAAFANGALVHALNFDAAGASSGHLGVVCLAAPLAAAQAAGGVSGRDFLAAVVAGCEITARITAALVAAGVAPSERYVSGQLLSYFGAAAGSARVLGLDTSRMRSTLGLALMQAAGSRQVVLSGDPPAKAIYGAFPCQSGVLAALLAQEGLGADIEFLSGPAGLFSMVYGGRHDAQVLADGLGGRFLFEEVDFKPWATSNHLHPFIGAALQLHASGVGATDIESVQFVVDAQLLPWCEPMDARQRPANAAGAANSLFFSVAKVLAKGSLLLSDFTPQGLADEAALVLAARSGYRCRQGQEPEAVIVTDRDGRVHVRAIASTPVRAGMPGARPSIESKFRDCCREAAWPFTDDRIDRIIALTNALEEVEDIGALADAASG
ncbi:MAG: hypothetical protein RLZ98_1505 [Pseudomonadota bacterium]